jgi:hypothetical protein
MEHHPGIQAHVERRRVGPCDRAHFLAHIVTGVPIDLHTPRRLHEGQVSGFMQKIAGVEKAGAVHHQTAGAHVDAGQESQVVDLGEADRQSDFREEFADGIRQSQKGSIVLWPSHI